MMNVIDVKLRHEDGAHKAVFYFMEDEIGAIIAHSEEECKERFNHFIEAMLQDIVFLRDKIPDMEMENKDGS